MSAMASQITGVSIVCWTVWSGADQRKHQSSASLAFVRGIHRWPVDSPHKGPVKGVSIVCWTLCSGADQRKYQSSVSLAFVRGIHRWPVDSPNKGPVTRKMFPFDYVIMHKSSVPHTMAWHFDCLAVHSPHPLVSPRVFFIVRRAGLLWSQEDFEWRWSVPLFKCLTVLEFSFILFDLCLLITFFNFIMNYVPIVTFWIFTYHKIWILSIMFCSIWSYWIIYFLACLEVSWRVVS